MITFVAFVPFLVVALSLLVTALLFGALATYVIFTALCVWGILFPKNFLLTANWFLIHTLYKLNIVGAENIPETGGAILVCNHVSYFDPFILSVAIKRPVRFIVYEGIANNFLLRPIAKLMRVIPISANSNRSCIKALDIAANAVKEGELVIIFAEGHVQRVGNMLPFTSGYRRIREKSDAPVIPVYLDHVWGTNWSLFNGKFRLNLPKIIHYPLTVAFGEKVCGDVSPYRIRRLVQELGTDVYKYKFQPFDTLPSAFLKTALKSPFRLAMANTSGHEMSYLKVLARVFILRKKLKNILKDTKSRFVGVMLPPSVESVLTNIAIYFSGKIPVNLNYTVPDSFISSVKDQTDLEVIVSAKDFLNKLGKQLPTRTVFVEDILTKISKVKQFGYEVLALLTPRKLLEKIFLVKKSLQDDLATLIFSSGSTGEPKGVMLSHRNITSNVEGFISALNLKRKDGLMAVLPFFHSFGFTITLWMPLLAGLKVIYHHNPFEATTIGKAIEKYKLSLLIGTPTFLSTYISRCKAESFATINTVVCGAEKLKEKVAVEFFNKFGLNIYEGYGCTETSPVVSVNLHDVSGYWKGQRGFKEGTVGRPLPQITTKVLDIMTEEELEANQEGVLYVKGPNVMMGYYNRPDLTAEVTKDGWYCTGDVAVCDADGFIKITDRINRFSKIAGEMVPHIKSEELIHALLNKIDRVCVVLGVPDIKKGERLVVLHTMQDINPRTLSKQLAENGLPNLWIPKPEDYYYVPALPLLGSGKLDIKAVKQMANDIAGSEVSNMVLQ